MKSIFVSSTFRDMQSERDILAQKVIPNLNVYAREYGENIRFVDLRWGVNTAELGSEEGNKKVLSVCLDEIDNTRPYMIVLVGERYGWIPPAELLKTAADSKKHPLHDYEKSVTELEIEYGALGENADLSHCLFYFREPLKRDDIPVDMQGAYIELDPDTEMKLQTLKEKIKASGALVKSYSCEWDEEAMGLSVPDSFADMVEEDVKNLFARDFEKLKDLSWQQREEISAALFAQQKAAQFSARYPVLEEIETEIKKPETNLFLMQGVAGSGKSTVMAKLRERLTDENEIFFFASGNSARSQTAFDLLKQIVYKLETLTDAKEHFGEEYAIYKSGSKAAWSDGREKLSLNDGREKLSSSDGEGKKDLEEWRDKFSELAISYTRKTNKPLYIITDALDQLAEDETAKTFSWLTSFLPEGVTVIASMLDSFETPTFHPLQSSSKQYLLDKLSKEEIPQIIKSIVKSNGKELSEIVSKKLSTLNGAENPLYISLALQRLLMLDSEDFAKIAEGGNDMNAINSFMLSLIESFPKTPEEMSVLLIEEAGSRIDENFCKEVASLLSVSRRGLRITDLQGIFSAENKNFKNIDFSLFTKYLSNFFMERSDGRIDFTHRVIRLGLLNIADFKSENKKILNHLKELDTSDEVRIAEIIYHAYKADDKEFLAEYIESIQSTALETAIKTTANELHDIALFDADFIKELIDVAIIEKEYEDVTDFLNFDFYESFTASVEEYEILLEIMDKLIDDLAVAVEKNSTEDRIRDYLICCNKIGEINLIQGDYENALKIYQGGFEISKNLSEQLRTPEAMLVLSVYYDSLGRTYEIQGDYDNALKMYQDSLEISENLSNQHKTPETMMDLIASYNNIGDIYKLQGDYDSALDIYLNSLGISESLSEQLKTPESMRGLAVSYNSIGNIYKMQGDYDSALDIYLDSLEIWENLSEQTKTPITMRDLAISYSSVGNIYKEQGDYDSALDIYRDSLEISESLSKQLQTPEAMRDLSYSYNSIGDIYKLQGDYENAIDMFLDSLEISESLSEKHKTPEAMRDVFVNTMNIGGVYFNRADYEIALSYYKYSVTVAENLIEVLDTVSTAEELLTAYRRCAFVCKFANKPTEQEEYEQKAAELKERFGL